MAKQTIAQKYESYKQVVADYIRSVDSRKGVAHATNKQEVNGKPGGVSIGELITIVQTAKSLKKHVVLEVNGPNQTPTEQTLTINLVDQYPGIPTLMRWPA